MRKYTALNALPQKNWISVGTICKTAFYFKSDWSRERK